MAREQNIYNFNLRLRLINESGQIFEENIVNSLNSDIYFAENAIGKCN